MLKKKNFPLVQFEKKFCKWNFPLKESWDKIRQRKISWKLKQKLKNFSNFSSILFFISILFFHIMEIFILNIKNSSHFTLFTNFWWIFFLLHYAINSFKIPFQYPFLCVFFCKLYTPLLNSKWLFNNFFVLI